MRLGGTILIYVIIIIAIIWAVLVERADLKGNGKGMVSIQQGRPSKHDTRRQLIDKIKLTARYEYNTIFWRRCLIAAAVSSFMVFYTINGKIPNGAQFGLAFLITYIILFLTHTLFKQSITRQAVDQIDRLANKIHS